MDSHAAPRCHATLRPLGWWYCTPTAAATRHYLGMWPPAARHPNKSERLCPTTKLSSRWLGPPIHAVLVHAPAWLGLAWLDARESNLSVESAPESRSSRPNPAPGPTQPLTSARLPRARTAARTDVRTRDEARTRARTAAAAGRGVAGGPGAGAAPPTCFLARSRFAARSPSPPVRGRHSMHRTGAEPSWFMHREKVTSSSSAPRAPAASSSSFCFCTHACLLVHAKCVATKASS